MAKDKPVEEVVEDVVVAEESAHVVFHLDKDPNDPRFHETALLPSLNDEGQS